MHHIAMKERAANELRIAGIVPLTEVYISKTESKVGEIS